MSENTVKHTFTPGPLFAVQINDSEKPYAVVTHEGRFGDEIVAGYLSKHDAALYAAAPDMLEAALPFEEVIQEGVDDLPGDAPVVIKIGQRLTDMTLTLADFRRLQAAISKATGA